MKVKGLTKCKKCKKMSWNGSFCIYCGHPGKVSKRGRRKK